jgi:phosphatidylserine/phosphatidylglycerophosphate/cardiolipin synthase-like enzyme
VLAHEVSLNTVAHVYFSPAGGCTEAIVSEINRAKSTILVQAYSFTSKEIAQALVNAHKRGVAIQIILDKSQRSSKYSSADFMSNLGILTFIDSNHSIAHNKVMLIDNQTVITGSFNFTKAAEEGNAENMIIVLSPDLARVYSLNWTEHRKHAIDL